MATHDTDPPRALPTGPVPRRWITVAIGVLACVVVLLLFVIFNPGRSAAGRETRGLRPREDSIVQTPPATPRPRPEPRSVETAARPSFLAAGTGGGRPAAAAQTATPEDPFEAERKKRDFDSLYAGNVVVNFRGGDAGRRGQNARRSADGLPSMPSTDDVAASVLRAFGGSAALPSPALQTTPAAAPERPAATGRSEAGRETPDETPPIDDSGPMHRVLESSIIDAVVVNRLDGSNASPIIGKVTNPLYSHNGRYVLIPADTKIIGETKAVQQLGESRLVVVFHRLIYPDGSTRSLDQFKGLHLNGALGLKDKVNHHFLQTLGAAAAISVVTGAGQAIGNRGFGGNRGGTTIVAGNVSDGVGRAVAQVLNRFLNRMPTITIREGNRFKVYVTSDLSLPVYPSTR